MMRRGFSLIMAVAFIVVVATLGALSLSYSALTQKSTTDTFLKEQAELLAMAATEYTVLAMQAHKYPKAIEPPSPNDFKATAIRPAAGADGNCLETIDIVYPFSRSNPVPPLFNINVRIQYFGNLCQYDARKGAVYNRNLDRNATAIYLNEELTRLTALVTVVVTTAPDVTTEPIRYVRSTLQRARTR